MAVTGSSYGDAHKNPCLVMPQLRVKTDICTAPRRGPDGKTQLRKYISEAELRGTSRTYN